MGDRVEPQSNQDPDEVTWITSGVAITNFFSAHQPEILAAHSIDAVLCLDRELQGSRCEERGLKCIRVAHLVDGANELFVFRSAVEQLTELAKTYPKVVVHCRAGRSRSIAVVAAFLMRTEQLHAHSSLDFVRSKRASAVAPELIRLVERLESDFTP